jgi:murein DD-endopeptidase MepM/ murein hydrolase activator NlpD
VTVGAPVLYSVQAGDTLPALALRFGVTPEEISSPQDITQTGFITPGQLLIIPDMFAETTPSEQLLPDSELIFSPSAIGFDTGAFVASQGGYLNNYREYISEGWRNGAGVIDRVALAHSINPQLLLTILQHESNWVIGQPFTQAKQEYPVTFVNLNTRGLHSQLTWVVKQLSIGYYGWRDGTLTELSFKDGTRLRIAPDLNAGTVALQYFFSKLYNYEDWLQVMDKDTGFSGLHASLFPDPWLRAAQEEPLFPPGLSQPAMTLPFYGSQTWSFTSGPHGAWEREGAMAALDFAPGSVESGCVDSAHWVTAAAEGMIVRIETGVLVIDLDGDGNEQTGWNVLYLHVDHDNQFQIGDWVERGAQLGNPACIGGFSTGTHLHIARKYNGEWMNAGGAVPFELSGWTAVDGGAPYKGSLVRAGDVVIASTGSGAETRIARGPSDPH